MKSLIKIILRIPNQIYHIALFKIKKIKFGENIRIFGRVFVINQGSICIGNNVIIRSSPTANPIGCGDRTYIQVLFGGKLKIGNNVGISNTAITCSDSVTIEDQVLIGAGCKIFDMDFHPISPNARMEKMGIEMIGHKPIIIRKNAFIGAGSFVLKGVEIGVASIIGAGSVVTKNIPEYQIWAGNPAKFVRNLTDDEIDGCNNKYGGSGL